MGGHRSLSYHEPSITAIFIQSSFLLLLNVVNEVLNSLIYCGLVGQIFLGIAWGTPLAGWIGPDIETAIVQLGYLGLLLLVYEGGLSTPITPLLSNLPLSTLVAATGIITPISLSFLLGPISGATPLQCFAAGAALSATSLGTTFTILSVSKFLGTRLGTVLTSAAIIDDVVGLVMIQVVSSLGRNGGAITGKVVGRPIGTSLGLLLFVFVFCQGVLKPLHLWALKYAERFRPTWLSRRERNFMIQTAVLVGLVAIGSYAGTSGLYAAFLAGSGCSWWDMMVVPDSAGGGAEGGGRVEENLEWKGLKIYEIYYKPSVERILKPFFFASIGFSIPIADMFAGYIVWRGMVYALLMMVAKLLTGIWLLRFAIPLPPIAEAISRKLRILRKQFVMRRFSGARADDSSSKTTTIIDSNIQPTATPVSTSPPEPSSPPKPRPSKPRSLYPSAILGLAMVARGEIGFLIASIAESEGIFSTETRGVGSESSDLYLYVIWATVTCTILGPVAVGALVKRVRTLEEGRKGVAGGTGGTGVLGVWGVDGYSSTR